MAARVHPAASVIGQDDIHGTGYVNERAQTEIKALRSPVQKVQTVGKTAVRSLSWLHDNQKETWLEAIKRGERNPIQLGTTCASPGDSSCNQVSSR